MNESSHLNIDVANAFLTIVLGFLAGPYPAALFIAFIGSLTRTAFEDTCNTNHKECFVKWRRYFIIAVGVAMFMVSACAWASFDVHLTVMTTAFFTIFSEELLIICQRNVKTVMAWVIKRSDK